MGGPSPRPSISTTSNAQPWSTQPPSTSPRTGGAEPPRLPDPTAVTAPFREAYVDLAAVRTDTRAVIEAIRPARLVADLGADAFGHGAVGCAGAVIDGGATAVIVSSLGEALAVRETGATVPIACPLGEGEHPLDALSAELVVLVRTRAELVPLLEAGVRTALVIETGVGMPGLTLSDLPRDRTAPVWVVAEVDGTPHTAAALEDALQQLAAAGIEVAEVIATGLPSSGTVAHPSVTARSVGPELFGLSETIEPAEPAPVHLVPAMTLWAPVVAVKRVGAGEGVSYGHTYVTGQETTLALVSLGYGDGLDRAAGNLAPVWVGGERFTVTGRMAMDAHVVDVGPDLDVRVGDAAVLFGDPAAGHPPVSDWAAALGVSTAEVTTRLTDRVRRTHR